MERGAWLWQSPQKQFGSLNVIGNKEKQSLVLKTLKKWNIKRLYTSCKITAEKTEQIALWNQELSQQGIRSYLLLSNQDWNTPENLPQLFDYLNKSILQFNKSRKNKEQLFVGIAFDLEPHIAPEWKQKNSLEKSRTLQNLANVFLAVRTYLNQHEGRNLLLQATLTDWYDSLPSHLGGTGSIGWESVEQRDQFFASLTKDLDSISLMAFEKPKSSQILKQASWERAKLGSKAIISLRVNLGQEWKDLNQMQKAMEEIEKETASGIDIQSLDMLMEP